MQAFNVQLCTVQLANVFVHVDIRHSHTHPVVQLVNTAGYTSLHGYLFVILAHWASGMVPSH